MGIRVLIVDDSPTSQLALRRAIERDGSGLSVAGTASSGREALDLLARLEPDVIAMDVCLGDEDGVRVAAQIMRERPTPILLVTGVAAIDSALAFRAMEAGALDVLPKLPSTAAPGYAYARERLIRLLGVLANARVARSTPARHRASSGAIDLVVIGSSTGGPPVLEALLGALRAPFDVPIAIVQHIAEGFEHGTAAWLAKATGHHVVVCDHEVELEPGIVVLAPASAHLVVLDKHRVGRRPGPARNFQMPSVDELFESAARVFGARTAALILTGMGHDGREGLVALRKAGARTIAQDPESCVVESMPASAIAARAIELVVAPPLLPVVLEGLLGAPAESVALARAAHPYRRRRLP
jgi:two-component system chemotaxis response regulator CheB